MLDILAAVVQDALVGALVLLLEVLHAQDDGAGLSVGPGLEAASLALGGQVFEPLFLQAHRYYKDKLSCMSDRGKSRGIDPIFVFFRKDTHLVPLHAWHGVAEDLEHDEEVLLLAAGELVRRLGDEPRIGLGLLIGARLQRCRRPVKTLKAEERRETAHIWLGRTRRRRRAGNGQTDGNACSGNILWAAPVWSPSSDHASYNIQLEHV